MKRVHLIVGLVMVIGTGLVHGVWTERWHHSDELETAAARVELVPLDVGGWRGQELPTDPEEFAQAGARTYWMRQYRHKDRAVTVLFMCGRAGRMSVHTPDICYQGLGYQMAGGARHVQVARTSAEFWTGRFTKRTGGSNGLQLYWAWNARGAWLAPSSPRWQFRGMPFLYKLYVVQDALADRAADKGPALEFLKIFVPALERTLFETSAPVADASYEPRP